MRDSRDWCEMGVPAGGLQATTEVGLLKVEEKGFIEATYVLKRFTTKRQRGALDPRDYTGVCVWPRSQKAVP